MSQNTAQITFTQKNTILLTDNKHKRTTIDDWITVIAYLKTKVQYDSFVHNYGDVKLPIPQLNYLNSSAKAQKQQQSVDVIAKNRGTFSKDLLNLVMQLKTNQAVNRMNNINNFG